MRTVRLLGIAAVACSGAGGGDIDRPVTVEVTEGGEPTAARVVFHAPGGEVTALIDTGPAGVATHPLEPGGHITIAHPAAPELLTSRLQLITYRRIDPGGDLAVEIPTPPAPPPPPGPIAGSIELELPPLEGADRFVVHLGCADAVLESRAAVIEVPAPCLGSDDRLDLTVDAFTPPDLPSRLATTYARGVEIGARVVAPDWIAPDPTVEVAVSDLPAKATDVLAIPAMLADGQSFEPRLADHAAIDSGASATLTPGFFSGFAEAMDLAVQVHAGVGSVSSIYLLSAPPDPSIALSASRLLPPPADVTVGDRAGSLSWTASGDNTGADATVLVLRGEREVGAVGRRLRWIVLAPPETAPPVALPELPAELADWRPRPGDDYLEAGVATFDVDWIAGYPAFVADHGAGFLEDACVPVGASARLAQSGAFAGPILTTR